MLVKVSDMLKQAHDDGCAIGAFNVVNLETISGVLYAAVEMKSPVILQITEKTLEYAGGRAIINLAKNMAEFYAPEIPVGIHLDHGGSFDIVKRATEIGFDSIMFDGSRKKYEDNVAVTADVVKFCHEKGVSVQGELGSVPYLGELEMKKIDWNQYMTDPDQAADFVQKTGIDALAVAIGNAHGFFEERQEPDYDRLEEISKKVSIPLVLHGASDWEGERVREVIKRGVSCFNVDTATRVAFVNNIIMACKEQGGISFDIRKLLGDAREAVKEAVKEKMIVFDCAGKAR